MSGQRPDRGVEYAAFPTADYRVHCSAEAVRSLAEYLGVTETRAADLLDSPDEYRAEVRSRMTPQQRLRELERRYRGPQ